MKTKIFAIVLALLMLLPMATSCFNKPSEGEESESNSEVVSDVKDTETETELETEVDTETETDIETETETETTEVEDTTAEDTTAASTEAATTAPVVEKTGCKSAVGTAGALMLVSMLAAGVVICKKKED